MTVSANQGHSKKNSSNLNTDLNNSNSDKKD
jgi:hypothetical protein